MSGLRDVAVRAGSALDRRPGLPRHTVRLAFSAAASALYTARARELTTLRWAPTERRWHHRWPEGRVHDVRRWRSPQAWATHGDGYDLDDLLWRHYRPRPGDVVLDIGAGHGGETFWLAAMVGTTGRVVAVEAAPGPFARLRELSDLNSWPQVTCHQLALMDAPGTVTVSETDDWEAGNVFETGSVAVRATTVDDLCAELGIDRVDWLKMNIEGAERLAVLGMEQMAPRIDHLTISCHDFLGTEWGRSRDQVVGWLHAHGYTVADNAGDPRYRALYVYAWRRP